LVGYRFSGHLRGASALVKNYGLTSPHALSSSAATELQVEKNSVTILRLVRSFTSSFYGKFESTQIREDLARPALAWLRGLLLCLR
jgi:hypothetical protein